MPSTKFLDNGLAVKRYRILCSGMVVVNVWERGKLGGSHGTVMGMRNDDGHRLPGWWGKVGTGRDESHEAQDDRARAAIAEAFPGALTIGVFDMGEVTIQLASVDAAIEYAGY